MIAGIPSLSVAAKIELHTGPSNLILPVWSN